MGNTERSELQDWGGTLVEFGCNFDEEDKISPTLSHSAEMPFPWRVKPVRMMHQIVLGSAQSVLYRP